MNSRKWLRNWSYYQKIFQSIQSEKSLIQYFMLPNFHKMYIYFSKRREFESFNAIFLLFLTLFFMGFW